MTKISSNLAGLRRPRILIEAARAGSKNYRREPALNRLFKENRPKVQKTLIDALLLRESDIEASRKLADGAYNGCKHVQVMTALMAESRRG